MSSPTITAPERQPNWALICVLAGLAALALWFIKDNALRYLNYDAAVYDDYWARRYGLIPHVLGGVVAISVGMVQIWLGLTGRTGPIHRLLGKIYLSAVAVGSAAGYYLSLTTVDPSTVGYRSGLFMLSTAWVVTSSMAYFAARRRAFDQHREWMVRSYVVAFAFVSFRLADKVLTAWGVKPDAAYYAMLAWGCWALPLLLAEPLLQIRKLGRGRRG
jgi:uncharacterized membrane protein